MFEQKVKVRVRYADTDQMGYVYCEAVTGKPIKWDMCITEIMPGTMRLPVSSLYVVWELPIKKLKKAE